MNLKGQSLHHSNLHKNPRDQLHRTPRGQPQYHCNKAETSELNHYTTLTYTGIPKVNHYTNTAGISEINHYTIVTLIRISETSQENSNSQWNSRDKLLHPYNPHSIPRDDPEQYTTVSHKEIPEINQCTTLAHTGIAKISHYTEATGARMAQICHYGTGIPRFSHYCVSCQSSLHSNPRDQLVRQSS